MLDGKCSLLYCLRGAAHEQGNVEFEEVLSSMISLVGQGDSLAAAMEQFTWVFPLDLVALVRQGELSGTLAYVLSKATVN